MEQERKERNRKPTKKSVEVLLDVSGQMLNRQNDALANGSPPPGFVVLAKDGIIVGAFANDDLIRPRNSQDVQDES